MNKPLLQAFLAICFFVSSRAYADSDLIITDTQLNSTVAQAGSTVSFNFSLKNKNITYSGNSYTGFYISTDSSFDGSDVYVTSRFNNGLASLGQEIVVDQIITIPQSITPGDYYILLYADYDQDVTESNEINNVTGIPITVAPDALRDLSITASVSTVSIEVGNKATVSATLYNNGPGYVGPNFTGMYLSTNPTFDPSDILVSSGGYTSYVNGNSNTSISVTGTIPENTPPGTYYLLLIADYYKYIAETNENNNSSIVSLTVLPSSGDRDLSISNFIVTPIVAEVGSYIDIEDKLTNTGISFANRSNTGYYLSTDNVLNLGTDYFLGIHAANLISGNSYLFEVPSLKIPSNFTPGSYYLFAVADYTNQIVETNETNNTAVTTLTIIALTKDVTIVTASLSASSAEVGNSITLNYTLKNIGTGSLPNNATYAIFSTSTTAPFSYYDPFVLNAYNPVTVAQTDYSFSYSIQIPYSMTPGTYYFVMKTDGYPLYPEIDENNNYFSIPFTVLANAKQSDLTITSPTIDIASLEVGDFVSGTYQLNNIGTSPSDEYTTTNIYLSTDNTKSADDIYLTGNLEEYISAGKNIFNFYYAKIPHSVAPGNYFIVFHADDSLVLAETNETNNDAYVALTLVAPANRDYVVASANLSASTVEASKSILIDATIQNSGTIYGGSSLVNFYLSSDALLDKADISLGSDYVSELFGGDSEVHTGYELFIDQQTDAGSYYILVMADGDDNVVESNENNNLMALPITILANDVDLSITSITMGSSSALAGDVLSVDFIVNNSGSSSCIGSYSQIYLSSNTTLDSQDSLMLDEIPFYDLLPGSSETLVGNNIQLPYNVTTGNYYILVRTDYVSYVKETNENNNVNFVPITITEQPIPDLVVTNFSVSSPTVEMGSVVSVKLYVKNIGTDVSFPTYVSLSLSDDAVLDVNDREDPNYTYIGELNPGDSVLVELNFEVPTGLQEKKFYLIAKADNIESLIERDETNNTAAVAIDVVLVGTKDLIVEKVSLNPEIAEAGGINYVSFSISNKGTSSVINENHVVYFSTDMTLDASDAVLTTSQSFVVPAGGSYLESNLQLLIPASTPDGNYYLLIAADDGNSEVETNETNNIYVLPLSIVQPGALDLTISAASASSAAILSGDVVLVSYTLKNAGLAPLNNFQTGMYFSTDNVWDVSDTYLTYADYTNQIDEYGSYDELNFSVTTPIGLPNGNYYLLIVGDRGNTLSEFNEANNVYALPIIIDDALSVESKTDIATLVRYFPTPSKDEVHFEFNDSNANGLNREFVLLNSIGEKMMVKTIGTSSFTLDVSSLSAGVYSFSITGSNNYGKLVVVK